MLMRASRAKTGPRMTTLYRQNGVELLKTSSMRTWSIAVPNSESQIECNSGSRHSEYQNYEEITKNQN